MLIRSHSMECGVWFSPDGGSAMMSERYVVSNEDQLLNVCKHIGLAVNTEKNIDVGRHRGLMANEPFTISSDSYEKLKTFKYLGSLLTKRYSIHEERECSLKAGKFMLLFSPNSLLF